MASSTQKKFYGYPQPKEAIQTKYEPKEEANPVLAGRLLAVGASLVANVPLLSRLLWSNAGFSSLRGLEGLSAYSQRFNPTVIPVAEATELDLAYTVPKNFVASRASIGIYYSVADYHNLYLQGKVTPLDVGIFLLPLIRRDLSTRHPHSTAFIDTKVKLVLAAAEASTARYKAGAPFGILDGVPVAVKDEVHVAGYRTTKGRHLDESLMKTQEETEWPVKKWEDAGAVLIGKLNMHELGTDTTNNNPSWGTPRNPYNDQYYTGGSSGGSGYAVAAGLVPITLGADGGGSIRLPSTFCGVYGLKPSHARIGDTGSTVTVLGPLAASIADLEVAYRVMATPDPSHTVCSLFSAPKPLSTSSPKVLGICEEWFDRADPAVQKACRASIDYLVNQKGYQTVPISIPYLAEGQKAHNLTILAEMSSDAQSAVPSGQSWTAPLSAANKILLSVGSQTPTTDYLLAQQLRHLQMSHLAFLYQQHPRLLIVTPTAPIAGYVIRDEGDLSHGVSDGNMTVRSMEYIWLANWSGCPAISCPVGYASPEKGEGHVPVGLMAMAEWGAEEELLAWGREVEMYIGDEVEGGRRRPGIWEDVLGGVQQ